MPQSLIIGLGPAGIGAAHALQARGEPFCIVESAQSPGGLATTDVLQGFAFDRTGHFLHMRSDRFKSLVASTGVAMDRIARRSAVALDGSLVPYPIQYNLWAVGDSLRTRAMAEIEARSAAPFAEAANLAEFLAGAWGPALLERFFRPYNEKLLSHPLEEIPPDCLGRFVPAVQLEAMRLGAAEPLRTVGYNAEFCYPTSGRIGDLFAALAAPFASRCGFGERVVEIDPIRREVRTDHRSLRFDRLFTAQPLAALLRCCGWSVPGETPLRAAAVRNIQVAFRGRMLRDEHWIYVPDPTLPFYRIGFPANVSRNTCPPGSASLSIECGLHPAQVEKRSAREIAESAVRLTEELGIARVDELLFAREVTIDPAYVIDRSDGRDAFRSLFEELAAHGIHPIGRYGRWEYFSMEDAFSSGHDIADAALSASREPLRDTACAP